MSYRGRRTSRGRGQSSLEIPVVGSSRSSRRSSQRSSATTSRSASFPSPPDEPLISEEEEETSSSDEEEDESDEQQETTTAGTESAAIEPPIRSRLGELTQRTDLAEICRALQHENSQDLTRQLLAAQHIIASRYGSTSSSNPDSVNLSETERAEIQSRLDWLFSVWTLFPLQSKTLARVSPRDWTLSDEFCALVSKNVFAKSVNSEEDEEQCSGLLDKIEEIHEGIAIRSLQKLNILLDDLAEKRPAEAKSDDLDKTIQSEDVFSAAVEAGFSEATIQTARARLSSLLTVESEASD